MKIENNNISIMEHIKNIIIILAFIMSVMATVWAYYNSNDINETNYKLSSMQNRPMLKVGTTSDSIKFMPFPPRGQPDADGETLNVVFDNIISTKVFTNTGNSTAILMGQISANINSGDTDLRDLILGKSREKWKLEYITREDYFHEKYIYPGDNITFVFNDKLYGVDNNTMTMHHLILYKNEIGIYYDTYYSVRYLIKYAEGHPPDNVTHPYKLLFRTIIDNSIILNTGVILIDVQDHNEITHVYSKQESEYLEKYFNRSSKRVK